LLLLDETIDDDDDDDAECEEDEEGGTENEPVDGGAPVEMLESGRGFLDADGCGIGEPPAALDWVPEFGAGDGGDRALVFFVRPEAAPTAALLAFASARARVGCIKTRTPTGLEMRRDESGLDEARKAAPEDFAGAFFA
jgi:hypothetical protein